MGLLSTIFTIPTALLVRVTVSFASSAVFWSSSVNCLPATTDTVADLKAIAGLGVTVTLHVAVLWPSTVVTVISALPAPTAVTSPFVTVATLSLLVLHVTSWFTAFAGFTSAVKVRFSSSLSWRVAGDTSTPVTLMTSILTFLAGVLPTRIVCLVASNFPSLGSTMWQPGIFSCEIMYSAYPVFLLVIDTFAFLIVTLVSHNAFIPWLSAVTSRVIFDTVSILLLI